MTPTFFIKVLISGIVIAAASELAKRNTFVAAILISLPLVSILSLVAFYLEKQNASEVAELSLGIFWMVLPSLVFFVSFSLLLRHGFNFWLGLAVSCAVTGLLYVGYSRMLAYMGIKL